MLSACCQHHQAIETERDAGGFRHEFKRGKKFFVDRVALFIYALFLGHLMCEALALLIRVGELSEAIRNLDPANKELESLREARIFTGGARQRCLAARILIEKCRRGATEVRLDPLDEDIAEYIRPAVIVRNFYPFAEGGLGQGIAVGFASSVESGEKINIREFLEGAGNAYADGLRKGLGAMAMKAQVFRMCRLGGKTDKGHTIFHDGAVWLIGTIPFEHCKFGRVKGAALAVSISVPEGENSLFARGEELLAGKFRRGVKIELACLPIGRALFGLKRMEMCLIAGRNLQRSAVDFGKPLLCKITPVGLSYAISRQKDRAPVFMDMGCPPRRSGLGHSSHKPSWPEQMRLLNPSPTRARFERDRVVSVIASSIRKGNVVERDGKLYVVLRADNVHPGKGTPVTHLEMRRISDGVKVNDRFKTTASVEKAFIDSGSFNYLYQDGDSYVFMEPRTFEQLSLPAEIIGDAAVYLQENMVVSISQHNGIPISIELPARVVLEVVETEPVVKGQTASSSFKPAVLSNGVRTGVPPHISAGTRVVVQTEDGAYLERAKD